MHVLPSGTHVASFCVSGLDRVLAIRKRYGFIIEEIDHHAGSAVESVNVPWFVVDRKQLEDDPANSHGAHE